MIRLRGADDDIGDVLDVDRTAVARGQQQQTNVRHALQGLADDDRQRAAVLAQRANDEGAVGVGQFVDELIERHAIERKPLWVGFDANLSTIAQAALAPGALDAKTKELIALAIGVSSHCDDCIAFHAKAAVDQGATRDEVLETLGMAIYMRAGPSAMYASHALGAFTQFEAAKSASANHG